MRLFPALLAACLCASVAIAQPAAPTCEPGRAVADILAVATPLVESGQIEEVLVIEGESLVGYVKTLQGIGFPIPDGLSHMVVAVRKDRTAVIFGFKDGCYAGKGQLGPGVHQRARGLEV